MTTCAQCEKWYRLSGSVKGECFKQKKRITLYNNECSDYDIQKE